MGRFQAVLLTALAELEAARKGARHREAHAYRAARGVPIISKRPYGWQKDGMELEPVEAEHLATALRNIITGSSIQGEATRMNEAGERTTRYANSGGDLWTGLNLSRVLDRPRMAGINMYLGTETAVSLITPIVTREEWEAYRAIRANADRLSHMGSSGLTHYLSGVAECTCGQFLRARPVWNRGKKVVYYECKQRKTQPGATHVSIAAHRIEKKVEMMLYGLMSGGWTKAGGTGEKVKEVRADLARLATRADELTEARMVPGVVKGKVDAELAAVALERERLESALEKALSDSFGAAWLDDLMSAREDTYESADAFKTWFDALEPEKRRALVRGNMSIKVGPGKGLERVALSIR